jgi:hypothetical protein
MINKQLIMYYGIMYHAALGRLPHATAAGIKQ